MIMIMIVIMVMTEVVIMAATVIRVSMNIYLILIQIRKTLLMFVLFVDLILTRMLLIDRLYYIRYITYLRCVE